MYHQEVFEGPQCDNTYTMLLNRIIREKDQEIERLLQRIRILEERNKHYEEIDKMRSELLEGSLDNLLRECDDLTEFENLRLEIFDDSLYEEQGQCAQKIPISNSFKRTRLEINFDPEERMKKRFKPN
jgi:hypothetical protein